jgi:hypothetical protein
VVSAVLTIDSQSEVEIIQVVSKYSMYEVQYVSVFMESLVFRVSSRDFSTSS